jgi:hypothetical protein
LTPAIQRDIFFDTLYGIGSGFAHLLVLFLKSSLSPDVVGAGFGFVVRLQTLMGEVLNEKETKNDRGT